MNNFAQNIEAQNIEAQNDLSYLSRDVKENYLKLLKEKDTRFRQRRIDQYYPAIGPFSRDKYVKHMKFFEMGQFFTERCIMAANRIGKSEGIGAYELTLHATGRYPDWWKGKRFSHAINSWAAGTTGTTARDIVQKKLLGSPEEFGTGLIPKKYIIKTTPKAGGVPNAVDTILVRHISGGISRIKIKSYAEGRKSFEGTEQDIIWLDEECPLNIYIECLTRTMTTNGHILLTFTPLEGLTETVLQFMPDGDIKEHQEGTKCLIMATWDDAPHLTKEQKDQLYAALPPHQREARSKGIPQLGSGAIYPIQESEITVSDFLIPDHWLRCYALDVGWKRTACLWGATDPTSHITFLYSEYYKGQAEPFVHAEAIKARGIWIPGVIDSAAHDRSQEDGRQLFQSYIDCGLDLANANKAVEAGIYKVWQALSLGRLKVFASLVNWFAEFRLYRRDENGHIVKDKDHLMDDTRYMVMSGLDRAIAKPYWEFDAWEESEVYNELNSNYHTGY
jgi:phage terminase large subunit-like protein